jgi:2-keto-4-pentenoate hydratase
MVVARRPESAEEVELSSDPSMLAGLAGTLWRAQIDRIAVAPITDGLPAFTAHDAYGVQRINVARRMDQGAMLGGRKVGLTSRASQAALGVSEPTFGVLLSDMFVDDGAEVAIDDLLQPRVEAELAFVLSQDLAGPGATVVTAMRSVECVVPVIEVGDSRIVDWRVRMADTIADNASSGRVVIGSGFAPLTAALDVTHLGVLFYRNGFPVDSGAGAAVLGNPVRALAWLANKLAEYGELLRAGELVLTGALHRMISVRPGDEYCAEFARLGAVSVRFAGRTP